MPAVPLGASGQGAAGPRLHGGARPAYHRHVTDTERPDNGSSSEPGTQTHPTTALRPRLGPFKVWEHTIQKFAINTCVW